jgi:hypothetical protein
MAKLVNFASTESNVIPLTEPMPNSPKYRDVAELLH